MQGVTPNYVSMAQGGCVMVFGLFFTLFSLIFLSASWLRGAPWFFQLFSLPFLAAGLGMAGTGAWKLIVKPLLAARTFGPAQASVSPQVLPVGERIEVRYERPVRRNVAIGGLAIKLILRETAQYRRGTNTYTAIHDNVIDQYEIPGRRLTSGETIAEQCVLAVPPDGMHSFTANRNRLTWLVKVDIAVPSEPDTSDEIGITVVPDIVEEESRGSTV